MLSARTGDSPLSQGFEPSNGESEPVLTSEDENEVQEFVLRKDSLVHKVHGSILRTYRRASF
jgi:hypothetical protein